MKQNFEKQDKGCVAQMIDKDTAIWYASYGSNLSAERFGYYIKGGSFNGRAYDGCEDQCEWRQTEVRRFRGELYFGNRSRLWNNKGVAFFDGEGASSVIMRLYKITWGQLLDVQKQEGNRPNWYGNRLCLGRHEDGCPIYTLTAEYRQEETPPDQAYVDLIARALLHECEIDGAEVKGYLERSLGEDRDCFRPSNL